MARFARYRPSISRSLLTTPAAASFDSSSNVMNSRCIRSSGRRRVHISRRRKRTFAPGRYDVHLDATHQGEPTPAMVLKSGLNMAATEIKGILDDLRSYSTTQINELSPEISSKFNRLINYVHLLYPTPEYATFHRWVVERYGDLREVVPSSVGGYLIGCTIPTSFSESAPGCAVICASSMPRPRDDPTFSHCQNTVLKGTFNGQGYRFTLLKKAESQSNHERAYLYIDFTDANTYPGFGEAEKRDLIAIGVKEIKLFGTYPDGRNYVELTEDLVPISNLKSRNSTPVTNAAHNNSEYQDWKGGIHSTRHKYESSPTSGANAAWIIVVVIIILIVIFLIWYWTSRSSYFAYQSIPVSHADYNAKQKVQF